MNNIKFLNIVSDKIKTFIDRKSFSLIILDNMIKEEVASNRYLKLKSFTYFDKHHNFYTNLSVVDKALIFCSINGYIEALKYTVSKGGNVHVCNNILLAVSFANDRLEVVKYLVKEHKMTLLDSYPFIHLTINTSLDFFQYLYEHTANFESIKHMNHIVNSRADNVEAFDYLLKGMNSKIIENIKTYSNEDVKRIIEKIERKNKLSHELNNDLDSPSVVTHKRNKL